MISAVSEIGISRKKMLDIKEGFKVEGWRFLEPEQVLLKKNTDEFVSDFPLHTIRSYYSKYDIFREILPPTFLMDFLQRRCDDREQGLTFI